MQNNQNISINIQYTGWSISKCAIKNLNISTRRRPNELKFLPVIETYSKFISIKTCLEKFIVKYHYGSQHKTFFFYRKEKNNIPIGTKITLINKKMNILITGGANELISLSMTNTCISFIFIKACLQKPFVKYIVFSIL